tara:strand:+ start:11950 stop:13839 length:1890 start_codon:yes stop_codon:yes gene_type:complete
MIGFTGVISFESSADKLQSQAKKLKSLLKSSLINSSDFSSNNYFLSLYDEDLRGCESNNNNFQYFVVGDFYNDDFCYSKKTSKAEYLKKVHHEKGIKACLNINGSYAFLIYDKNKNTYFIGTDQHSFIPVYYSKKNKSVFLSWDISRILSIENVNYSLNFQSIFSGLLFGGVSFNGETRFNEVYRLEPGALITIDKENLSIEKSEPFYFKPSKTNESDLISDAANALRNAVQRRIKNFDRVSIGLTSGIDSRLVLSAGIKDFQGEWISFTFGGEKCIDRDTASKLAKYFNIKHVPIEVDDYSYLNYDYDGVFYTGGASLFQMGLQIHLYATLKNNFQSQGLIEAPATGLLIGGHLIPGNIDQLKSKDDLIKYYQEHVFNFNKDLFLGLFQKNKLGDDYYDLTVENLSKSLSHMKNNNLRDAHQSLMFHERTKRWANYNMINILYSHRPILPTYDLDFLKILSTIPSKIRENSSFRSKLLMHIDEKASDFVYDRWMQPAWLCPPYTLEFEKIVKQIEDTQHKIWFDSGKKIYLKSNRFEANFLEYIRVYPEYQKYFMNLLLGDDSFLSNSFLKRESLKSIIEAHISGKNDYHKILILLASAELTCRIFEKNEMSNVNHEFNYFSNLEYIK